MPDGTILLVDHVPCNRLQLSALLTEQGHTVLQAGDGAMALALLEQRLPDLVLLNTHLPGLDGFDLCRRLKADPRTRALPVILICTAGEALDKDRVFSVGASDYVSNPLHAQEVLARVSAHLSLRQKQRELDALRAAQGAPMQALNDDRDWRSISHDLRNSLALILSAADELRRTPLSDDQAQMIAIIERKASHVLAIISNALDSLAAEAAPRYAPTSLRALVQESLAGFDLLAAHKRLAFDVHLPEEDALVQVERRAVSRVIGNLVSNAIKYTTEGGVEVRVETAPETFSIIVRDSGLGIPAEALPRIFNKFYRAPQPKYLKEDGTGLGLAIVKAIVERHQGTIQVATAVGVGSIFRVTLPRQPKQSANHHGGGNLS
ncbi:MAG: hybrid sensor histidine kinase/response regulator [Chloroflexi bacterium]|nr:hybrid sensor histidine kinase/response regulator [Chloroflexota bacterium]